MKITVEDIAKHAGTNIASVSNTLRDTSMTANVSQETQNRIRIAAKGPGYHKNAIAASIRTGFNPSVALIIDSKWNDPASSSGNLIADIAFCCGDHGLHYITEKHRAYAEEAGIEKRREFLICGFDFDHTRLARCLMALPPEIRPTVLFASDADDTALLIRLRKLRKNAKLVHPAFLRQGGHPPERNDCVRTSLRGNIRNLPRRKRRLFDLNGIHTPRLCMSSCFSSQYSK